jgi:hypothetical protein
MTFVDTNAENNFTYPLTLYPLPQGERGLLRRVWVINSTFVGERGEGEDDPYGCIRIMPVYSIRLE